MRAFIQSRLSTHGRQGGFAVDIDDVLNEDDGTVLAPLHGIRGFSMPFNRNQNIRTPPGMPRQRSAYTTPSQRTVMRECSAPATQ